MLGERDQNIETLIKIYTCPFLHVLSITYYLQIFDESQPDGWEVTSYSGSVNSSSARAISLYVEENTSHCPANRGTPWVGLRLETRRAALCAPGTLGGQAFRESDIFRRFCVPRSCIRSYREKHYNPLG